MSEFQQRRRPFILTRTHALLAGLVLVVLGGVAGAAATASYVYYWRGDRIEITDVGGGREHVKISDPDGNTLFDEVLEPDTLLFQVDPDDADQPMIKVSPDGQ